MTGSTANVQTVSTSAVTICLSPLLRQIDPAVPALRDTPPDACVHDHDWQQVSWLAGRGLRPPSQDQSTPVVFNGHRLAAYSCGGSRGIACRNRRTAFPWLALTDTTI